MSAAAGDLTTLDRVKRYLKLEVATGDDVLQDLITSASAWIKSYLNREILEAVYTETVDGTGTNALTVDQYPITTLTSVVVDGQDLTAYTVATRRLVRLKPAGGRFTRGVANVVVTYTAGYATVPPELEQCAVELVAWRNTERTRIQQVSKSVQGEVVAYSTEAAPKSVIKALDQWRKVVA